MEELREEKELREFSWSNLFLVTGGCFLVFAGLMKLIEGSVHPLFLRIGLVCLFLRLLAYLIKWQAKKFPASKGPGQREFL